MKRGTRRYNAPFRLLAAVAALLLIAAACATDEDAPDVAPDPEEEPDEPEPEPDEPEDPPAPGDVVLTMATGSTGGTYFPLGGAMAGVWTGEADGVRVSTQASGASVENLRLLNAGEVDLIMAVNGVAANALVGAGDFEGEDYDFTFLGNVYGEVTQIIARADTGIESIEDMAGMRIQIGPPGSGTEVSARAILSAAGIDPDSDIDVFQDTFGDAIDSLRDGVTDAAFGILALPHGGIEDASRAVDMNFVSITGDLLDGLLDADETLSALEVEAGTYPGQDDTVTWVTNWATLYAPTDLPDGVAYELVRVLYEHNEDISNAHAVGRQIQLDTALDGRAGIPIHPGAEQYYQEAGAL